MQVGVIKRDTSFKCDFPMLKESFSNALFLMLIDVESCFSTFIKKKGTK